MERSLSAVSSERDRLTAALESIERTHAASLASINSEWAAKLEKSSDELTAAMKSLESSHASALWAQRKEWEVEQARLVQCLADKDAEMVTLREAMPPGLSDSVHEQQQQLIEQRDSLQREVERLGGVTAQESKAAQEALAALEDVRGELRVAEGALEEAHRSKEGLEEELAALRAKASAVGAGRGEDSSLTQEQVNQLMQDIYSALHAMFAPHDSDDDEAGAEATFTSQDVLKRCRRVLKQVFAKCYCFG